MSLCPENNTILYARAILTHDDLSIGGIVDFDELVEGGAVRVHGILWSQELTPGNHGMHIHQYGDPSLGCDGTCHHFDATNPTNKHDHGDLNSPLSHLGDLGNVYVDPISKVSLFNFTANRIRLRGIDSIVGHGLVVHEDRDDLGLGRNKESKKSGNTGYKIICGGILYRNPNTPTPIEWASGYGYVV